jgi:hypothetical protein
MYRSRGFRACAAAHAASIASSSSIDREPASISNLMHVHDIARAQIKVFIVIVCCSSSSHPHRLKSDGVAGLGAGSGGLTTPNEKVAGAPPAGCCC